MCASVIRGERTFCLRKMNKVHTCGITQDSSRVNNTWLSEKYKESFRSDPNLKTTSAIDNAMRDHGAEVSKMMAYGAKWKAAEAILGNHVQQYTRIRDYL